ncbi:MAG TPA: site-specific integrase [Vicinamibacterales bacterium]|nr:site-specific integrase [Vicinamibacterales bacterium]
MSPRFAESFAAALVDIERLTPSARVMSRGRLNESGVGGIVMLESSGVLACTRDELFTDPEALALSGFLAGYSGLTRDAYSLDLRQYAGWVTAVGMRLFETRRFHIEAFARELEARGRARATIARRLGTITCFYRYAEQEGLIDHSPAVHVRRPKLDYESHAVGLDRNELGAMLVAAGLAGARDHARSRCSHSTISACPKRSAPESRTSPSSAGIAR